MDTEEEEEEDMDGDTDMDMDSPCVPLCSLVSPYVPLCQLRCLTCIGADRPGGRSLQESPPGLSACIKGLKAQIENVMVQYTARRIKTPLRKIPEGRISLLCYFVLSQGLLQRGDGIGDDLHFRLITI